LKEGVEMIYDQLCGIVERTELSVFKDMVEQSVLFQFPGAPEDILPKDIEQADFVKDHFFLPFPTIAIEDNKNVILLQDPKPGSIGLEVERLYLQCEPIDPEQIEGITVEEIKKASGGRQLYSICAGIIISHGYIFYEDRGINHKFEGNVGELYIVTKDKIIDHTSGEDIPYNVMRALFRNAKVAIEEVMYFNHPDRFVVEIKPASKEPRLVKGGSKIPRSDARSIFTLLTANEIRQYMELSDFEPQNRTKSPHGRRRHYRTLSSDLFINKKGETIAAKASWSGPDEVQVGNKIYKVRLDI
jgi:hypothetical protein